MYKSEVCGGNIQSKTYPYERCCKRCGKVLPNRAVLSYFLCKDLKGNTYEYCQTCWSKYTIDTEDVSYLIIEEVENMFTKIIKHGENDFSIWVTDDLEDIHSGWSVRGTWKDIYSELVNMGVPICLS